MDDEQLIAITQHALDAGAIQKGQEFFALLRRVSELDPQVIVEIGSDSGGTLHGFRAIAPGATLISIDLPKGPFSSGRDFSPPPDTTLIQADSHLVSTWQSLVEHLGVRMIDALFIDGDHTYLGVRQDFLMYAGLVRSGGIVIFHDIVEHADDQVGVGRLWAEVHAASKMEYITEPVTWGGVGIAVMA